MKHLFILLFALLTTQSFAQLEHCKEILAIRITEAKGSSEVTCDENRGAGYKAFGGYCDNKYFKGVILPGGYDNMKNDNGEKTLSARYMLAGKDYSGDSCHIFIENNTKQGATYSLPKIYTDSKALAYLNDSELIGYLDKTDKQFIVRIYIREESRTIEKIRIQGSKGMLAATLEKPKLKAGERCPIVIICHGFGGNRDRGTTCMTAKQLPDIGIASIRFDFNGHGESEGRFEDMTVLNEIEDAKCVYQYVSSLPWIDTKRIAILGASQGGVVASMTAGELGLSKLAAVVLMCPAAVLRDDCIKGNTMGKQYNPLDPPERINLGNGKVLGREFIKTAFYLPIYETAERFHGKACIIHGTGDRTAPYTYGVRYHQIWPGSEYHQLEGYDHGFAPNPQKAVDIAINYLERVLH
jgi:alpha/beta superfamily hydrolase